jgi:hypothetical protein
MDKELALKVVKSETPEQTAERIVELYETIAKLTKKELGKEE